MADRAKVVATVKGYIPSSVVVSDDFIGDIADCCVETIGSEKEWTWRVVRDDTFTILPATPTYDLPDKCETVLYAGKLESGVITQPFGVLTEQQFVTEYQRMQGMDASNTQFIEQPRDQGTSINSFRIYPAVAQNTSIRIGYLRYPSIEDYHFISNTMMIVYLVLASLPSEQLSTDSKNDSGASRYWSLYQKVLAQQKELDKAHKASIVYMEQNERASATNAYIGSLTR
jgi:hypothetical protein